MALSGPARVQPTLIFFFLPGFLSTDAWQKGKGNFVPTFFCFFLSKFRDQNGGSKEVFGWQEVYV